jgi:GH25 family lysozyme M1 (1,4-beta-N-acetylmuramidase)
MMLDLKQVAAVLLASASVAQATVQGFDISHYQANVNFAAAYNSGARFVMIKATESTTYTDPSFSSHYTGATNAGFIRGGYHFAIPDDSSGAAQAKYFLAHGGGWSNDGITLPGMLDIEYNPYGATCYGLSASQMVSWISDFVNTYKSSTGRYPMIYTTADWWNTCTGNSKSFTECPLVLARYSSSVGTIPGGWPYQSFWQNSDSYTYGGDSEIWNGSLDNLKLFAKLRE